jgi:hypothetical protein
LGRESCFDSNKVFAVYGAPPLDLLAAQGTEPLRPKGQPINNDRF